MKSEWLCSLERRSHNFPSNYLGFGPSVPLVFFNWSFLLKAKDNHSMVRI